MSDFVVERLFLGISGDEKVVSLLGWAGEAYSPSCWMPREAFSCTHVQLKWPRNTNSHMKYQELFECYLLSPTGFTNSQPCFPSVIPKYAPLSSATQIPNVRFWMRVSQPPPQGNTLSLKPCHFGKLQSLRVSQCTLGHIRTKESRSVKQHTLTQFLKHPESFVCH